jgi:molybdate-binding protein/transcriptional regulator with XRE-family HTH domain
MSTTSKNTLRVRRTAQHWSQQELADRAGLSRAGVSAIEAGRLAPSVNAALALSKALGCSVEDLFAPVGAGQTAIGWAFPPATARARFWNARVGDRLLAYPVEDDSPQLDWHDDVSQPDAAGMKEPDLAEQTLVVAGCDPAAGLLAAEYARQFRFRMIVLRRSSRQALELLAAGKVHAAGLHFSQSRQRSENMRVVRSELGQTGILVRVARWDEGLALDPRLRSATLASIKGSHARWVGREAGSGARQCQDEVLGGRPTPRRVAFDHKSVAAAVRCGWADIGPCVRLTSEESGLGFLKIQEKDYDLCFTAAVESDPRIAALVATLRSRRYRSRLAELPGYSTRQTGDVLE